MLNFCRFRAPKVRRRTVDSAHLSHFDLTEANQTHNCKVNIA